MSNKLSFSIALNLLASDFKKGANQVMSSLRSMQYQVLGMAAAMGAGSLALSDIAKKMVQVARETNIARTALRNVSGSVEGFNKNMKYLMQTAATFGQDLNTLTINFARFSAAGNAAGVSAQDQEKIYTSVTRAVTAFGLSGEEANLTFMALQQMMAKGKISSEELRRQMGERMPVAMEAMAKAAGVNIQELDKMLKSGSLLSKDILPRFADALTELIPEVNLDNLETSINRLRTEFTYLTDSLGVGDLYKKIVEKVTDMFREIRAGTSNLVAFVIALVVGKMGGAIMGWYGRLKVLRLADLKSHQIAEAQMADATEKRIKAEKSLTEAEAIFNTAKDGERVAAKKAVTQAELRLERAKARETRALRVLEESEQKASLVRATGRISGFYATIRLGAIRAFGTLKALWASFAPMAIISAVTFLVTKFIQLRKETKEIASIFKEYKSGLEAVSGGGEAARLKQLHDIYKTRKGTADQINAAQTELMKMLGLQQGEEKKINKLVADRLIMLEATARFNYALQQKMDAEKKMNDIYLKYGGKEEFSARAIGQQKEELTAKGSAYDATKVAYKILDGLDRLFDKTDGKGGAEIRKDRATITQLIKVLGAASDDMGKYKGTMLTYSDAPTTPPSGDPTTSDGGKDPLKDAQDKYIEGMKSLKNRLDAGNILQDEYNKEVDALSRTTADSISGLLGVNAINNGVYKDALKGIIPELTDFDKAQKEYNTEVEKLKNLRANGVFTEKQYNHALTQLNAKTITAVGAMSDIGEEGKKFVDTLKKANAQLIGVPEKENRDTTFDYKKSASDKIKEQLSIEENYLRDLEETVPDAFDKIAEAQGNVKSLKELLKLTEVTDDLIQLRDDIKDLKSDLVKSSVGFLKDFDSGLNGVVNAWERLNKAMSDTDSTPMEKFSSFVSVITESVDGVYQTIEAYNKTIGVIQMLTKAKEKEGVVSTVVGMLKKQEAATTIATSASNVVASGAETAADTTAAAAKVAKVHAGIPFVGIVLAAAAIAGLVAMISSAKSKVPKYAGGGIVGGGSIQGDNLLVGLNSGEMILNKSQQSNLFRVLDKGGISAGSGKLKFEIEGRQLVAILEQENKLRRRV